jgi:predicted ABC-type transport system involved in lysophospholipase L1 biosynthesis ATPase subunit
MIELHDIEGRHFQLDHAAVPGGELAAFVAPTAACAREFVDVLLGLATPRRGAVRVLGQALATLDEAGRLALRARLGFAAQMDGLVGHLALWENILLGAAFHRRGDATARDERVRTLLGWCGWPEAEARRAFARAPERATPFERAAAAWLRALLSEPELLVCEDLLSGLGTSERRRLIDASVNFQSENPTRGSVFVLVGERLVEELQPTSLFYLSRRGDFRAESVS